MPVVLVVEDYDSSRHFYVRTLEAAPYAVRAAASGTEALACLENGPFDAALLDVRLPGVDGLEVGRRLRDSSPATPIVIITSFPDYWAARRAMALRPEAWLDKPVESSVLLETMAAVLAGHPPLPVPARPQASALPAPDFADLVGQSPAMLAVYRRIALLGPANAPVLIRGETGTGKDLVARALHRRSPRRTGPFEPVQISAIPDTLFETQMFGHEAGAFTDARAARPGWFEVADGGTLFLDEIGDLSPGAQARLLRVLEDPSVTRVGSTTRRRVDVRILAATNRDLEAAAAAREFRPDLLHRLAGTTLDLPPLRARGSDLDRLIAFYLPRLAGDVGGAPDITPAARAILARHAWPGNVRELQNVLRDALVAAAPRPIDIAHLPVRLTTLGVAAGAADGARIWVPATLRLPEAKAHLERELIQSALARAGGNRLAAARTLGIDAKTLRRKLVGTPGGTE